MRAGYMCELPVSLRVQVDPEDFLCCKILCTLAGNVLVSGDCPGSLHPRDALLSTSPPGAPFCERDNCLGFVFLPMSISLRSARLSLFQRVTLIPSRSLRTFWLRALSYQRGSQALAHAVMVKLCPQLHH